MEALKAIKIIGNQNDVFISSKYRVTKGFKFHARPQTGAYSCYLCGQGLAGYCNKGRGLSTPLSPRGA